MHFLIGLGVFVVLLYWWLIANWFARVLVFLLLTLISTLIFTSNGIPPLLAFILAGLIAWPVASVPLYYQRRWSPQQPQWSPPQRHRRPWWWP
jgi:hypothetical protein